MLLLFGAVVRNRPMAVFGATVVVLLNIGRLVSGCANLAVIPLRDGFDFQKMKRPFRRVIEPAITIGLVILAFTFIPWLSFGDAADKSIRDRLGTTPRTGPRDRGPGGRGRRQGRCPRTRKTGRISEERARSAQRKDPGQGVRDEQLGGRRWRVQKSGQRARKSVTLPSPLQRTAETRPRYFSKARHGHVRRVFSPDPGFVRLTN